MWSPPSDRADLGRHLARIAADVRLVGDVVDRARLRARAEQRALRARQRLDALDVDQPHVGLLRDRRHRLVVEVDRHLAVDAELARSRRDAAHHDHALARDVADEVDGGQGADQVVRVGQRLLLDELGGERGDALGDLLQVFAAPRRGDDDGLESGMRGVLRFLRQTLRCRIQRGENGCSQRRLLFDHQSSPPGHGHDVSDRRNILNERTTKNRQERISCAHVCQRSRSVVALARRM